MTSTRAQREQATINGKLYGVSLGGTFQSLLYNQSAIQQAGMQPPTGKESWGEFGSYCKQLQAKLPAGMAALDDCSWDITPFEVFVRQRTKKELYTSDGKAVFTNGDALAWFNLWQDYLSAGSSLRALWPRQRISRTRPTTARLCSARQQCGCSGRTSWASTRYS